MPLVDGPAVGDPADPLVDQCAVVSRPGHRLRYHGVLMLYPDRLVHARTQFASSATGRVRRRVAEGHRSVTSIRLETVQRIEYPTRKPGIDGIAVITEAGEEYWFRGTDNTGPIEFHKWSAELYTVLGKLGRHVPPPTIEDRPASGPLPGTSPMGTMRIALFGLAAGAATAAAYAALSLASGEEDFYLLVCIGFLVGLALSYGPPWMSRVRLCIISALIGIVTTAAATYTVSSHYRESLATFSTLDLGWLAACVGFSVLVAAGVPLTDYDLRIFNYLRRPRRSRAHSVAAAVAAGAVLIVSAGALAMLARPPTSESSASRMPGTTPIRLDNVRAGDCFNEPQTTQIDALPELSCDGAHDDQVFYVFKMKSGAYPGDDQVTDDAMTTCQEQFDSRLAGSVSIVIQVDFIGPNRSTWDSGDRTVWCYLYSSDGAKLTTSMT